MIRKARPPARRVCFGAVASTVPRLISGVPTATLSSRRSVTSIVVFVLFVFVSFCSRVVPPLSL